MNRDGPLTASALVAAIGDPGRFATGRHFAAWLGLAPKQNSSGGKDRLGSITKMGDRRPRSPLVAGATAVLRHRQKEKGTWVASLLARKSARKATVALANKMVRIAWAILTQGAHIGSRRFAPPESAHPPRLAAGNPFRSSPGLAWRSTPCRSTRQERRGCSSCGKPQDRANVSNKSRNTAIFFPLYQNIRKVHCGNITLGRRADVLKKFKNQIVAAQSAGVGATVWLVVASDS